MSKKLDGQCLCGAVTFSAVPQAMEMDVCHCSQCRKWSGGSLMAVPCDDLDVKDETQLGIYPSSDWGERLFCKTCGTNLFWRMKDQSINVVMAQAFDDPSQFVFTKEVFIDERPDNYAFANNTEKMTGAEFMALYASQES